MTARISLCELAKWHARVRSCGALQRVTRLQLACVALATPGGVAAERACPPALLATHWT